MATTTHSVRRQRQPLCSFPSWHEPIFALAERVQTTDPCNFVVLKSGWCELAYQSRSV